MAKNDKQNQQAQTPDAPAPVAGKDLGAPPAGFKGSERPEQVYEQVHTFMPGQDWKEGVTLAGRLIRTRRVFSDKYNNPKYDEQGRPYRDLHEFTDLSGKRFNIWGSVGMLDVRLAEVPLGASVAITYLGRHAVEGVQGTPHTFKILLEDGKTWSKRANPVEINEAEGAKYLKPRAGAPAGGAAANA